MPLLLLLRHARAQWAEPGTRDFDRPLSPAGRQEAAAIGNAMRERGLVPESVLCSTALRATETLDCAFEASERSETKFADALYSTDAAGYLTLVREAAPASSLLLIGHNPMMEDLAVALAYDAEAHARRAIAAGFTTAGLAVMRFDQPLSEIAPGTGLLEAFIAPPTP